MADISGFWSTGGTTGDQQVSYTQAQWSTAAKILAACSGFEGVAPGFLNSLACTYTGANTVAMNTGGALVDGKWYYNDASQNITIPSASAGTTRVDRIVLRASWAGYTVAPTVITGTVSAPAITQTSGTTYDIYMYQASVTDAGVVTLTDERTWGSRFINTRQGGHATSWYTPGTTAYTPSTSHMQAGVVTAGTIAATSEASVAVTFPHKFSAAPIVYVTAGSPGGDECTAWVAFAYSSTGFTGYVRNLSAGEKEFYLYWLAIGPS